MAGNGNGNGNGNGRHLISIPETPDDFLAPTPRSRIADMQLLMRNPEAWQQIKPFMDAISGLGPSIHGSPILDEAGMVFTVQSLARANGHASLITANAAEIRFAYKWAYKGNTGIPFGRLAKQGAQLRLEHKEATKSAAE